jgi:hypothetical protein
MNKKIEIGIFFDFSGGSFIAKTMSADEIAGEKKYNGDVGDGEKKEIEKLKKRKRNGIIKVFLKAKLAKIKRTPMAKKPAQKNGEKSNGGPA